MNLKIKSSFTLRQVLTIPYVILVLTLALTIGVLSYFAGSRAVDTVSSQLLLETLGRIGQAVDRHIVGSGAVLEAAFPDGMPVAPSIDGELDALRTRFWIATSLHLDPNNYVYFGNRIGQGVGLFRHSRTEGELRLKLKAENMRSFYRFSGIGGKLGAPVQEAKFFDPRERPWYKAGANQSLHTWTSVYIDFITEDLVATRARRVLGPQGEFEGVVATDVSLRALNDFVSKQHVSSNGVAFIVEPNGDLIASSASRNVKTMADGSKTRISADLSGNPLVTAVHNEVKLRLPKSDAKVDARADAKLQPQSFKFTAPGGQVIHAAFDRLKDDAGLQWITVVAMPRSDFMAGVTDNVIRTVVLSALAALLAIVIGMRILSLLARDLSQLSEAANRVGQGQLNWPVGIKRPDEIGQLARSFESMQQRLQTDDLTTLANREAFMLRLRQKIAQAVQAGSAGRFAVLFIDLNHFKHINDNYGHTAGDAVLIEVAHRLRASVRAHDMVARLAGDEFVVLLDQVVDRESLERVRGQIQAALKEPLRSLGKDSFAAVDFGGSVGEALYPDDGQDADSLIRRADRRMYGQKFANRPPGSVPFRRASDPTSAD
jgi:diguanylate cyclase (GGDEF)-like protein